mgnify:CR=1 FL=1
MDSVNNTSTYPHTVPNLRKNGTNDLRCGSLWAIIPSMNTNGVKSNAIHRTSRSHDRRQTAPRGTCKVPQSDQSGNGWHDMVLHPLAPNQLASPLHRKDAQRPLHRGSSRSELDSRRRPSGTRCDSPLRHGTSGHRLEQQNPLTQVAGRIIGTPQRGDRTGRGRSTRDQSPGRMAGSVQRSTLQDVRSRFQARQEELELNTQNTRHLNIPGRDAQGRNKQEDVIHTSPENRCETQGGESNRLTQDRSIHQSIVQDKSN